MRDYTKYLLLILCIVIFGCNSDKDGDPKSFENYDENLDWEDLEWEMSPEEEQEQIANQKNYSHWDEPKILSSSLRNLNFIQNHWTASYLLCSENENYLLVKTIESYDSIQNLIAVSSFDRTKEKVKDSFFFYHFNINGKIYSKHLIESADYSISERSNFVQEDLFVYFFLNHDQTEIVKYDISKRSLSKMDNDGYIEFHTPGKFYHDYPSSSGNKTVKLEGAATTLSIKIKNEPWDTLIHQKYSGDWSIGEVAWSDDETKFYFDNSGAVACIWEVNLYKKTIDKIVPEHVAHSPIYFTNDSLDNVIYCEGNCIKITTAEN